MSLKNELRNTKLTKEDTVATFFEKITRLRDDLLAIDEIILNKELVINAILGLPHSLSALPSGLNSWKVAPSFE